MGMMECVDPFVLQGGDAGLAIRICSPFSTWLPIYQQTRPCLADPSPSSIPSPPLAPFPFLFPSGPLSFPFFRPLPSLIHILTSALLALLAILLLSPAKLMAEESVSASSRHAGPALQRGKACLRCRSVEPLSFYTSQPLTPLLTGKGKWCGLLSPAQSSAFVLTVPVPRGAMERSLRASSVNGQRRAICASMTMARA